MSINNTINFVIPGQPYSKANSRQLVVRKGRVIPIKSKPALAYVEAFKKLCPVMDDPFTDDVFVMIKIFYGSRRPDLDESLILDCMQGCIYGNDRQVKLKLIIWGLDKDNPRSEITVGPLGRGAILAEDIMRDIATDAA